MPEFASSSIGTATIHPETVTTFLLRQLSLDHHKLLLAMGEPALVSIGAIGFLFIGPT